MKLGNTMQVEWEMMRDENLREEQREKETQQATRAFWCDRDNRIERERVGEIDLTIDGMEMTWRWILVPREICSKASLYA